MDVATPGMSRGLPGNGAWGLGLPGWRALF